MVPRRTQKSLNGLLQMIQYINKTYPTKELSILEIGCWVGVSTELFAKHFKSVVACDPFVSTHGINTRYNMAAVEKEFDIRIKKYKNIIKVKLTSESFNKAISSIEYKESLVNIEKIKASEMFFMEKFDVIYIDGAHDIVNVCKDIILWKDRARLFLCGHDYWQKKFPGVIKAVNGTVGWPDKVFPDASWIFFLRRLNEMCKL